MELLCHLITIYGDYLVLACIFINLANLWIMKIGIEPDGVVISMFALGLILIILLSFLLLLNYLTSLDVFSGCLKEVFK